MSVFLLSAPRRVNWSNYGCNSSICQLSIHFTDVLKENTQIILFVDVDFFNPLPGNNLSQSDLLLFLHIKHNCIVSIIPNELVDILNSNILSVCSFFLCVNSKSDEIVLCSRS